MPGQIDDVAETDLANLIDAVGELIAAVLNMHGGIGVADIASVDIGNARHV
jgi:hypothetical protein